MDPRTDDAPSFVPLTADRWPDVERLFGPRGACGGCWCMYGRLPNRVFEAQKGALNRAAFQEIVAAGHQPGVLAYAAGEPIGWCAVAPRPVLPRLATSRVLAPVDDQPVWAIHCLFVDRRWRRRGLSTNLIRAAAQQAVARGATVVEAYPVEPAAGKLADAFVWTGLASAYRRAGFVEVARRSPTRPIMRWSPTPEAWPAATTATL